MANRAPISVDDYELTFKMPAMSLGVDITEAVRLGLNDRVDRLIANASPEALAGAVQHATKMAPGELADRTFARLTEAASPDARDAALMVLSEQVKQYEPRPNGMGIGNWNHNQQLKQNPALYDDVRNADLRGAATLLDHGANDGSYRTYMDPKTHKTHTVSARDNLKNYRDELNELRGIEAQPERTNARETAAIVPVNNTPIRLTKEQIIEAQTKLSEQGYDIGGTGADGIAGKRTAAAIRQFEQDHGLKVDGKFDANMLAALAQAEKAGVANANITGAQSVGGNAGATTVANHTAQEVNSGRG